MDSFAYIIIYLIIFVVFYVFSKKAAAKKDNANASQKNQPKKSAFEDILQEITKKLQEGDLKPQKPVNKPYVAKEYTPLNANTKTHTTLVSQVKPYISMVPEKHKPQVLEENNKKKKKNNKNIEEKGYQNKGNYVNYEDPTQKFQDLTEEAKIDQHLDSYKTQKKNQHIYANYFKNPQNVKMAFIASEIFKRKFE